MTVVTPRKKQRQIVQETPYGQLYLQEVDFGSFTKEYFVTDFGEKAGIVVVRDDAVLFVRQYRLFLDQPSFEIPGGKVDEGERAEEAAVRECFEETGIQCCHLKPLLSYHQGLEAVYTLTHLFYTHDARQVREFIPDPKEVRAIEWIPLQRCFEMIQEGKIIDSFSILALFAYRFLKTPNDGIERL